MTAKGIPVVEARCGKWMPNSKAYCALPRDHTWRCRTPRSIRKIYDRNNQNRRERVARTQERINRYKLEHGCIDCGYAEHAVALDFDHRDPDLKIANVSSLMWAPWDRIVAELEKCDVRCACCHRVKTHVRRIRPGTNQS